MSLDLGALEGLGNFTDLGGASFSDLVSGGDAQAGALGDGKTILKLADIDEDENQPREEFDLDDIRASIRANIEAGRPPIKTPISVKPNPEKPGRWLLNDGARRYRSALAEGLTDIPAFIDEIHDEYDQVVVNIQRHGHTPLEIANFIKRKMSEGDNKTKIAQRLGKTQAFVSKHAALIDMPEAIRAAYDAGRCRELEALYLMVRNYENYPDQIDALCQREQFSRLDVQALLDEIRPKPQDKKHDPVSQSGNAGMGGGGLVDPLAAAEAGAAGGAAAAEAGEQINWGFADQQSAGAAQQNAADSTKHETGDEQQAAAQDSGAQQPEAGNHTGPKDPADPEKLKKPIVQVQYDERPARLQLNRRPTAIGLVWIKYDDDGAESEVDITQVSLAGLIEGA